MKAKHIFTITLATALMSSCGVLKNYNRNDIVDINTDNIYGDAQSGDSLGLGDLKWRDIFTDPTLQSLIEKALVQNTDIKNTDLQLQEIQYALKASKLAFIPSMYFTPQGNVSKMYDPYQRSQYSTMTQGNNKTFGLPVTFGWQNVNFFALRNQKKGAEINREQLQNAKQAVQAALVANVASLYYSLCMLDEQKSLTEKTRDNWALYLEKQRLLMEAGQANTAAVASIEATYYSICQGVLSLDENIRIMENALCTLLGESNAKISRNALSTFQAPAIVTTGAPISILSRRPDVRGAELALASAFYDSNKAKSAFFPSLTLSSTGTFTNSFGQSVINPGMMIGSAIASLTQPIFANGALRAQYKVSKKEMEIAANNFQQAVVEAGNEVNTAMHELKIAEEQKDLINKQVSSLETALSATEKLYAMSSMNYLNVITAQNSLLQAQMSQISNRMDAINATIDLYQALGGGTE